MMADLGRSVSFGSQWLEMFCSVRLSAYIGAFKFSNPGYIGDMISVIPTYFARLELGSFRGGIQVAICTVFRRHDSPIRRRMLPPGYAPGVPIDILAGITSYMK